MDGGLYHLVERKTSRVEFQLERGANGSRRLPETMLGGIGWIDYDGDDLFDLYLVNGHEDAMRADEKGKVTNRLYKNLGGGRFRDVTEAAGVGDQRYGMGMAVGDYDNDGHADLFVSNFGRNTLFHNRGDGTFEDVTARAGVAGGGFHASAAWFDMDNDGDLDLYVTRYLRYHPRTSPHPRERGKVVYLHPKYFSGETDLLFRNEGDGRFVEIGADAGIANGSSANGKGLGVVCFDYDGDGDQDVYVANDLTPNFLWENQGDGSFKDVAFERGVAVGHAGKSEAGMGVDIGDPDANGYADLHVTNFAFETNALYLGGASGSYVEGSRRANLGTSYLTLGFGTAFIDVDLDGDTDIVALNGHVDDLADDFGNGTRYAQAPLLYLNRGDGVFSDGGKAGGPFFAKALCVGRGLAPADWDNDGDVDLAAMTMHQGVVLLENKAASAHGSVRLRLRGTTSCRDGYGARITVQRDGRSELFCYASARSYLSAADPRTVLAVGKNGTIDRVTIRWPSGTVQTLEDLRARQETLVVEEP